MVDKKPNQKTKKTVFPTIAVVRIRGGISINTPIKDTFDMLNLKKVNSCILIPGSPEKMGMILKVKDFVTWGEINKETEKALTIRKDDSKNNLFRLSPPRKGFERKGIKKPFKIGGALGYRAEKINDLIMRMI
jgi:large subunit ribosomal protein L30